MREDILAMQNKDPAAGSLLATALLSPGLHAVWGHRLHHHLWCSGHRFAARLGALLVRTLTGIEIHPAAHLGRRVVIDHGMGVVIGETAEVGDDVLIYHGVTLGAAHPNPGKRHPTIERGVTLGTGATVLGAVTVGADSHVGAGAVVTRSHAPRSTLVGVPAAPSSAHRRLTATSPAAVPTNALT